MTKSKPATVAGERLKSFIERIEKLKEEQKAIAGDVRDVFSEAKGVGYDVKTMRKVITLRAMDAADRDEQEALLDTYWHALTTIDRVEARVASGESIRKAAAAEGMPKSTAIRQVTQNARQVENGSGEEAGTGSATGVATGNLDALSPDSADISARPSVCSTEPEGMKCDGVLSGRVSGSDEQEASAAYRAGVEAASTPSAAAALTLYQRITGSFLPAPSDDPGPMPPFLRRARA